MVGWFFSVHGTSFLGEEPPLESLAVIKCGFGRGLVSGIGAVGAERMCRSMECGGILITYLEGRHEESVACVATHMGWGWYLLLVGSTGIC